VEGAVLSEIPESVNRAGAEVSALDWLGLSVLDIFLREVVAVLRCKVDLLLFPLCMLPFCMAAAHVSWCSMKLSTLLHGPGSVAPFKFQWSL
jgi:hypothetical protein